MSSRDSRDWDRTYAQSSPAWEIGRPQPVFVELAERGRMKGRLLDIGCGTGEQAILAASHGADALGVDISPVAIKLAVEKAKAQRVQVRFRTADAFELDRLGEAFDVALDSGLFHGFADEQRPAYIASVAGVLRRDGLLYLCCMSDRQPGDWGPRRISERDLLATFADGWVVEELSLCDRLVNRPELRPGIAKAWIATIRHVPRSSVQKIERAGDSGLAVQLRAQSRRAAEAGRSPLFVALLAAAADDLDSGGVTLEAFAGFEQAPGVAPGVRLFAALHYLVLAGLAPELAPHFDPDHRFDSRASLWPAAGEALRDHLATARRLLHQPTQTNEPGRAAPLFGALLLLAKEHKLPIRLLEIGASAGLNLNADRFHYRVDGRSYGDTRSPLLFAEPWQGKPLDDLDLAQRFLSILERRGCDSRPIDPWTEEGRRRLQSHIWPDERGRMARLDAALQVAFRSPVDVAGARADEWLTQQLASATPGALTVIWQSVLDPYLPDEQRRRLDELVEKAGTHASAAAPLARVRLEAPAAVLDGLELHMQTWPGGRIRRLARSASDGPPVTWLT